MFTLRCRSIHHQGPRSRLGRMLLLVLLAMTTLAGAATVQPAAAEPNSTGAGSSGVTLDTFEQGCFLEGGQPFEITDSAGNVTLSVCERSNGLVDECNWGTDTCNWGLPGRTRPTTNPLQDTRPGGTGGVFVDETITPVIEGGPGLPPGQAAVMLAGDAAADQASGCKAAGGSATTIDNRSTATIDVRCSGGILDGMVCKNGHYGSICDFYRGETGSDRNPVVRPTGSIMFLQAEEPSATATNGAPEVAEDPTGTDTVVIANQSGSTVTDNATGQVLACRGLGGTETVIEERTVGSGLKWVDVHCKGGLLDGMWCANGDGYTICVFRSVTSPTGVRPTPASEAELPSDDVPRDNDSGTDEQLTPIAVPTESPPTATAEPTVTPTGAPIEPTVAPTTAPPPPRNDNAAPTVDVVDPTEGEPTPTVHVIL